MTSFDAKADVLAVVSGLLGLVLFGLVVVLLGHWVDHEAANPYTCPSDVEGLLPCSPDASCYCEFGVWRDGGRDEFDAPLCCHEVHNEPPTPAVGERFRQWRWCTPCNASRAEVDFVNDRQRSVRCRWPDGGPIEVRAPGWRLASHRLVAVGKHSSGRCSSRRGTTPRGRSVLPRREAGGHCQPIGGIE